MIIFIDARDNVNPYARRSTDPAGSPQLHFSQSSQPPHHGTSKQSCWQESKLAWRAHTVLGDVRDGKRALFSFPQVHSSLDEENACKTKWLGKIIVTAAMKTQTAWEGKMRLDGMLHRGKRMREEEEKGEGKRRPPCWGPAGHCLCFLVAAGQQQPEPGWDAQAWDAQHGHSRRKKQSEPNTEMGKCRGRWGTLRKLRRPGPQEHWLGQWTTQTLATRWKVCRPL